MFHKTNQTFWKPFWFLFKFYLLTFRLIYDNYASMGFNEKVFVVGCKLLHFLSKRTEFWRKLFSFLNIMKKTKQYFCLFWNTFKITKFLTIKNNYISNLDWHRKSSNLYFWSTHPRTLFFQKLMFRNKDV